MRIHHRLILIAVAAVVLIAAASPFVLSYFKAPQHDSPVNSHSGPPPIIAPFENIQPTYSGSESCRACHEKAFVAWTASNHGLAERKVRMDLDEKTFAPKQTLIQGNNSSETFLADDHTPGILTRGFGNQRHPYNIVRIIGNDPLRQFLIPAKNGRLQTCDISYDPKKNELFNVYGNEERNPGDWGAWTGQGMNWNSMCAACHNTRLRKEYEPQTDSYHTRMVEMSVGCEACHGPMKDHVTWQNHKPAYDGKNQPHDPTLRKFTRDQMLDTCGACHARRGEITGDLVPGESFFDHFSLTVADDTDLFYPDGQVREEDYEFTPFLTSKMQHKGIRCVDCHDPHTGKRLLAGNALCMRCHGGGTQPPAPFIIPALHGHHQEDSKGNDCTACHMPVTPYMQRHPRHDHGFTIPDPQLTLDFAVPNACNRCHNDKDASWALLAAKNWYGDRLNRPTHTRATLIASARRGNAAAQGGLIHVLAKDEIPAWRATAAHLLARWVSNPEVTHALTERLFDRSPLVREAAVRALLTLARPENESVRKAIRPLLDDPVRSVRVAAAWALFPNIDLNARAGRELLHMLDLNSDQPTGRAQLSQFAFLQRDTPSAIRQLRKAILLEPNSPILFHDLAVHLSSTGDTEGAIKALDNAVRLAPDEADYQFKLALAWNEAGDIVKSTVFLERCVRLDPSRARAWYNLGLARNSLNQPKEAVAALLKGADADPKDADIPYARATILARMGRRDDALAAATLAVQLRPDFPEAIQLIQALSK